MDGGMEDVTTWFASAAKDSATSAAYPTSMGRSRAIRSSDILTRYYDELLGATLTIAELISALFAYKLWVVTFWTERLNILGF